MDVGDSFDFSITKSDLNIKIASRNFDYSETYMYEFTNIAKFVYEKTTGILLACRLNKFVNGIIDGTKTEATMDYLIEQKDYAIPANEYITTYSIQINLVMLSFVFGILPIQKIKGRRMKKGMK